MQQSRINLDTPEEENKPINTEHTGSFKQGSVTSMYDENEILLPFRSYINTNACLLFI